MKEIILFTSGDSTNASTWSNVPYLMAKHFELNDIVVNRVDISSNRYVRGILDRLVFRPFSKLFGRGYNYERTPIARFFVKRIIKKNVARYKSSDFCVFLTFDYVNKYNNIPSLLFSDWTYRMKVEDREQRLPSKIEKLYIKYEDSVIESADIVLPMFSESYKKMIASCPAANIKKIELNVINNMYGDSIVEDDIVNKKLNSDYVLFIGRKHYKKGLQALIKVIKSGSFGNLKVHVIGMGKELFPEAPDSVIFHGFLRKDVAEENELYYKLIIGARILINITPLWGGYSSLVEGMYFYTPIIAYPFEQLTDEFSSDIGFGRYCKICSENSLRDVMSEILHSSKEQYRQMCLISHEKVKMYTWDNYVKHMLQLMDEFIENR